MEANSHQKIARRQLLKLAAAAGGVAAGSALLPSKWSRPKIGVGVVPAHAQVTGAECSPNPDWDLHVLESTAVDADIDLEVWDPGDDGEVVDYSNMYGPTATHSGDNIDYEDRNWERVTVPAGGAASGIYYVWFHNHDDFDVEVTVRITTPTDCAVFTANAPAYEEGLIDVPIASITFPGGMISRIDTLPLTAAAAARTESK